MKTIMSLLKNGFVYTSLAVLAIAGFLLFLVLALVILLGQRLLGG